PLMRQRHDDRLLRMPHVPKHQLAAVEEGAGGKEAGHIGAEHLKSMPPRPDLLRADIDADDVGHRDIKFAAEGPQFVQTLDAKGDPVSVNGDVDHTRRSVAYPVRDEDHRRYLRGDTRSPGPTDA